MIEQVSVDEEKVEIRPLHQARWIALFKKASENNIQINFLTARPYEDHVQYLAECKARATPNPGHAMSVANTLKVNGQCVVSNIIYTNESAERDIFDQKANCILEFLKIARVSPKFSALADDLLSQIEEAEKCGIHTAHVTDNTSTSHLDKLDNFINKIIADKKALAAATQTAARAQSHLTSSFSLRNGVVSLPEPDAKTRFAPS